MPLRAYLWSMATRLRKWLSEPGHSVAALSERSGVPIRSLYRYVDNEREAPLHHAVAISAATDGEVRVEDMVKPTVPTNAGHATDRVSSAEDAAE